MRLGEGREAEVVAWADGYVLKLFWPEYTRQDVEWEASLAQQVWLMGLSVPKVVDVLETDGRWGIVFDRIQGLSLTEIIQRDPKQLRLAAQILGAAQREIHSRPASQLPSQRARFAQRIEASRLDPETQAALLAHLERLPQGSALCHGDFHPENLMITEEQVFTIDWPNATCGNPVADVARTSLLILHSTLPLDLPARQELLRKRRLFHRLYLERYFAQSWYDPAELKAWMPVVAAVRLREGIEEEEAKLMDIIQRQLQGSSPGW